MKKLLFITLGLAALFGLTACVEQQNVSPTFNPVDNTINTQFVFNISALSESSDPSTKQADTNVQANGNFRGIDNATLFALIDPDLTTSSPKARRKMVVATTQAQAMRDLSTILQKSAITNTEGGTRIIEINLPVGTNELIIYGKAAKQAIPGLDNRELYGSLQYTTTPENYLNLADLIGSYAERRLSSVDSIDYENTQTVIECALNGIFATGINCSSNPQNWYDTTVTTAITFEGKSFTMQNRVFHWADYYCASSYSEGKSPYFFVDPQTNIVYPDSAAGRRRAVASELEKILGNAYVAIANPHAALEIRGGSGAILARSLSDLHNIVSAGANATPVTLSEAVAQVFFKKLTSSIEKMTNAVAGSRTGERVWKDINTVANVVEQSSLPFSDRADLNKFPEKMNLPAGATTIGADYDNFKTVTTILGNTERIIQIKYDSAIDTMLNGGSSTGNIFTFPPELCYYGNSSIRVNNTDNNNDIFPTNYQSWYNDASWSGAGGNGWEADGSAITNATRAIAMTNTIHYGMSLLASRVDVTNANLTDNGAALGQQTKRFQLSSTHYLDWTGILIGGQPEQVGWNYLLKQQNGVIAGSNAIVYDKVNYRLSNSGADTCGIAITREGYVGSSDGTQSGAYINYTLVFDNVDPYAVDTTTQNNVYVALEFVNHLGEDFWGQQGLIRDGATFYLFAKLMPVPNNQASTISFWNNVFREGGSNNHYLLPPYETTGPNMGESRHIRRVFVQDIKTGVTFTFGPEALAKAYVSIPDLRSAKISLGMAVDLKWTEGLTYNAPLGTR